MKTFDPKAISQSFHLAAVGMAIIDLEGRWIDVNRAFCELVGYSEGELLLTSYFELSRPDDEELERSYLEQMWSDKLPFYQVEKCFFHKSGYDIVSSVNGTLVYDEDNNPSSILLQIHNLTQIDRPNKEQAYRFLVENTLDVIVRLTPELHFQYVTPNAFTMFGYHPEELVGTPFSHFVHPEDMKKINESGLLSQFFSRSLTFRFIKKDGSFIWIETKCNDIYSEGEKIETISVFRNINKRNLAEVNLLNSEKKVRAIFESANDAIIVVDEKMTIINWNKAAERLFGYTNQEAVGQNTNLIFKSCSKSKYINGVELYQELGAAKKTIEVAAVSRDGTEIPVEITLSSWKVDGEVFLSAMVRDVTTRKKTEEILLNSEKLTVAGQFAAGIAHEIRNPLTSINGFLQLLRHELSEEPYYFPIIIKEINRIEVILSELLLLAKPQRTTDRKVDLTKVAKQIATLTSAHATLYDIEIIMEVEEGSSYTLLGDENQIKQTLINFLKNAIEAMPNGGEVKLQMTTNESNEIVIKVVDQGVGIPPEQLSKIGNPFFTTKETGTGLGFMISKQIVENHQGKLEILSEVDIGTTIEITFPQVTVQ
ncbi:PAS domain S-box protein [Halalkalibacter krulwichiae]|uniref:histidine kinase n=1 Tax=Halalkalibacter krulwichiae TaxID=199441 RepID=A0A1X9MLG1_9BACI|nr:PAS domain S-box protein [Halalkalibacter krulwichiae]ARK32691.1 Sporulation kinase A [Halalkalibacter krulwichiae]